ncbi:MAG: ATP-dependent DNA helicase RecQ, partial [Bacteroidales bacterium]|nr:ATP-dependent DNA helicase RecQ [Bacteroidales bacterium]
IAFYSYKDIQKLEKFMQGKPISEQEIGRQLLMETVSYAESSLCRRKVLLNYFGEDYYIDNCGSCDNCLYPKKQFDGKDDVALVLELISTMKEQFKTEHLANIMAGVTNSIIKSYNHHKLELFGIGKSKGIKFWMAVIRQALIHHLLFKDIEKYGLISCTPEGLKFLENPYTIMLIEDREFVESEDDDETSTPGHTRASGGGGDEALLSLLKDLRHSVSKKLNLPPFVIFSDPSLDDMSLLYPLNIDELKNCQGVGEGKAKKFGKEFVELIAKYVLENEIDRPMDLVVKSVVNKSAIKVHIINGIDRKLPLEDIAESKGIEMEDILNELEAIVNSGTKINIDYFIRQTIDDDKVDEIYQYFRTEAVSDSLKEATEELGKGYTEDEIRLVRIKFLSELGN